MTDCGSATWILFFLAGSIAAPPAHGFQIQSSVGRGCHEQITLAALEQAGWPDGRVASAMRADEGRVAAMAPFPLADSVTDPWTLALLFGVRYNDLRSISDRDLGELAEVHSDPSSQREHCLRGRADDGPDGDLAALAACRAFLVEQVARAVGESEEAVDMEGREAVTVGLAFQGATEVQLARYPFHAGRALHTLQDSYTHTFRAPGGAIRSVLNWVDWASSDRNFEPGHDGHPHLAALDLCDGETAGQRARVEAATRASAELLRALVDPAGGRDGRLGRAGAVFDGHLAHEPGCTADNGWCGAPELLEAAGCSIAPGGKRRGGWVVALLGLLLVGWRHRRLAGAALLIALGGASVARAADPIPAPEPLRRVGLNTSIGISIDQGGLAGSVGVRVNLARRFALGVDAEWNPWYSIQKGRASPGTVNLYLTALLRLYSGPRLELRSSLHVGATVLLTDLVGADVGSVGPFLGASLLGVSVPVGRRVRIGIDPTRVMVPVPKVRGVPVFYPQYQVSLGLEFWS